MEKRSMSDILRANLHAQISARVAYLAGRGIRPAEIARQIGTTQSAVSKWVAAPQVRYNVAALKLFADTYGWTLDELFERVVPDRIGPETEIITD